MNIKQLRSKDGGFVVALVLIGILVMSFYLVTSSLTTKTSIKISGNYSRTVGTFNIAEAGLAKARPLLEAETSFTDVLTNYPSGELIPATLLGDKTTYSVYVRDNHDDGDGDENLDNDGILIITSVGRNSAGGTVEIETYLQKIDAADPIDFPPDSAVGPGAGLMCGNDSDVKVWGSASMSGCDWDYETGTKVDACASGGPAIISNGDVDETTKAGSLEAGAGANTIEEDVDDVPCNDWRTMRDQFAALDDSAPGVTVIDGSGPYNSDWNDCDSPEVFIINTAEPSVHFSGGTMCGVIIVASNTNIITTGGFSMIGLVMVMGDDADLALDMSTGNSSITGQIIVDSLVLDKGLEVDVQGTAEINYSSNAMAKAAEAMSNANPGAGGGGAILTVSWKETY